MAFVNEYIPEADYKKYELRKVCGEHNLARPGRMHSDHWTIDREKDEFLIKIWSHHESIFTGYAFYWKGSWIFFEMKITGVQEKKVEGSNWVGYLIKKFYITEDLEASREEIISDLTRLLCVYCGAGVFSTYQHCAATIEFMEGN